MKLTEAQLGILGVLDKGFGVTQEVRYTPHSEFYVAKCEHLPTISSASLAALSRLNLISFIADDDGIRYYQITAAGRAELKGDK